MNHVLNVCLFRFAQGLEGHEIDSKAAANIRELEQTLARTGVRQDLDYFEMVTGS